MKAILELGQQRADAEQRGDTGTLERLTTDDFTLFGPLGFVLRRPEWLERYRTGGLVTRSLTWADIVREYGDTAVVVGRHTQRRVSRHARRGPRGRHVAAGRHTPQPDRTTGP